MKTTIRWHTVFLFSACLLCLTQMLSSNAAGAEEDLNANNIVIVLDSSGSMNTDMSGTNIRKINAAKGALLAALKEIPKDTNIGLLVFSAENIQEPWVFPLGPRNDQKLEEAINLPEPGDGTPLGEFIKKGADELLKKRAKQHGYGTYRLLIVTDGEATDEELMELYVPDVMSRGVIMDVIGVDMESKHTLATKVNSYRRADDPEMLKKAVSEVFAEVAFTGSDAASEEAFAQIAPIPDKMAGAMLKSLSVSGNYPIGEKPESATAGGKNADGTKSAKGGSSKTSNTGSIIYLIIFIMFVLFSFKNSKNRKNRRR